MNHSKRPAFSRFLSRCDASASRLTEAEETELAMQAELDRPHRIDSLPTPAEIANECARIRAGWTASERTRRSVGGEEAEAAAPWHPPVIEMSVFGNLQQGVTEAT